MTEQELIDAFRAAQAAADAHRGAKDGGTCNMDSVYISAARRGPLYLRAAEAAGVGAYASVLRGRKRIFVGCFGAGQGARRTAMAEAFARVLADRGLDARVHYVTD